MSQGKSVINSDGYYHLLSASLGTGPIWEALRRYFILSFGGKNCKMSHFTDEKTLRVIKQKHLPGGYTVNEWQSQCLNPQLWVLDLQTILPFLNQNILVVLWFQLLLRIVGWGWEFTELVENFFPSLEEATGPGGLAWRQGWVGLSGHWGTWHRKAQGLSLPQKKHIQHCAVPHSVLFISKNGASPLKAKSSPRPLRAELCGVSPCPRRKELHFYPLLILEAFLREFSFGRSEGGSWMNAK